MIETLLSILPTLLDVIPGLVRVIKGAFEGGKDPDEDEWLPEIRGLEELLQGLRAGDRKTVDVVTEILAGVPDALHNQVEQLRLSMKKE